jgi:hypothetical protein
MADQTDKTLGQLAFEAYRETVQVAFNGDPIPEWGQLDNGVPARRGWEAAAEAIQERTRTMDAIERALTDPSSRVRRSRPLKSHAEPLDAYIRREARPADRGGMPLPPVSDERAESARQSVPVEAEDDDSPEAA